MLFPYFLRSSSFHSAASLLSGSSPSFPLTAALLVFFAISFTPPPPPPRVSPPQGLSSSCVAAAIETLIRRRCCRIRQALCQGHVLQFLQHSRVYLLNQAQSSSNMLRIWRPCSTLPTLSLFSFPPSLTNHRAPPSLIRHSQISLSLRSFFLSLSFLMDADLGLIQFGRFNYVKGAKEITALHAF
ncbi:hypothetical protein RIF29_08597 [Crotalaria pallida]|uniref:Uncharacterized protein n=1 Tax=Crotalaria pallida TaxID=3830 RepID=A0AAN9FQZ3_CROPI